jgi:hypothetical protein
MPNEGLSPYESVIPDEAAAASLDRKKTVAYIMLSIAVVKPWCGEISPTKSCRSDLDI